MKTDKSLMETNLEPAPDIKRCPVCKAVIQYDETICLSCGAYLSERVCPYCLKSIPLDEDPCHFCGHLEPAAPSPSSVSTRERKNLVDIFLFVFFLVLVLAMIIYPLTNQPEISACEPDQEISCFLETSWGVPGGILLITLSMFSLVLSAIINHWRQRN